MRRSRPDPEQLYGFWPGPEKTRPPVARAAGQVGEEYPDHNPIPNPEVNPGVQTRTILLEIPMIPVPSPRTVRAVGFSGTYTISHYILWVMFDNFCIWCNIHHPRLS